MTLDVCDIMRMTFLYTSLVFLCFCTLTLAADSSSNGLRWLTLGDWGVGNGNIFQIAVADQMAKKAGKDLDFILSLGDNFYESGVTSLHDSQWENTYEKVYNHPELDVPFLATLGNHDYEGNTTAQIERHYMDAKTPRHPPHEVRWLPAPNMRLKKSDKRRWIMPDRWYSVLVPLHDIENSDEADTRRDNKKEGEPLSEESGNEKISSTEETPAPPKDKMATDSGECDPSDDKGQCVDYALFIYIDTWMLDPWDASRTIRGLQLQWIQDTLTAATLRNEIAYIFVVGHYPIFSSGLHGPSLFLQDYLLPLITVFKVDAYFCGHDHDMEIMQTTPESRGENSIAPTGQSTFVLSGAASKARRLHTERDRHSIFGSSAFGFTEHTVNAGRFTTTVYDTRGRERFSTSQPRQQRQDVDVSLGNIWKARFDEEESWREWTALMIFVAVTALFIVLAMVAALCWLRKRTGGWRKLPQECGSGDDSRSFRAYRMASPVSVSMKSVDPVSRSSSGNAGNSSVPSPQ